MNLDLRKLITSVAGCLLIGFVGGITTASSVRTWYIALNRPWFTPPNWLFGPVWTTLYVLMGLAWYLVWINGKKKEIGKIGKIFVAQLFVNLSWSLAFFGLRNLPLSLVVIAFLWVLIVWTMKEMKKVSMTSFWLMVPYILWVSFASILNLAFVVLN